MKKIFFIIITALPFYGLHAQTGLRIGAGTNCQVSANTFLVLNNTDLVNNGTLTQLAGTGALQFSGSAASDFSGNGTTSLSRLTLFKNAGVIVNLQTSISVTNELNFSGGLLNLGSNNVDLINTGVLAGESEASRAYTTGNGYIQRTGVLNIPVSVDLGKLGAIISSGANLGSVTIRRGHNSQTNGAGNGSSILRYYLITPTNNSGLNATLRFTYFNVELNGLDPNSLVQWKSVNGTSWSNQGFTSRGSSPNYVEKTGINDFSTWTLSSAGNVLPVHFVLLNSLCNGNNVVVKWRTAGQENGSYFNIERSSDGRNWSSIGSISSTGNGIGEQYFQFIDNSGSGSTAYYRITETDLSGRKTVSSIIRSSCATAESFSVYPNPVLDKTVVNISCTEAQEVMIYITDSKGAVVQNNSFSLLKGNNQLQVDMKDLPAGTYTVTAKWSGGVQGVKVVKL